MKYFFIPLCRIIFALLWLLIFRPFYIIMLSMQALWEWDVYELREELYGSFFEYCNESCIRDAGGYPGLFDEYRIYKTLWKMIVNKYDVRIDRRF